ncbi:LemA family protein [Candidatus Acetothermia bacterium]|nr:LemA family protein [Candidatus Acetothermia bacterium]
MEAVLILFLSVIFGWSLLTYTRLKRLKMRTEEAWSILNTYLNKRHDLVLSLVKIMQKYNVYDQKIFDQILQTQTVVREVSSTDKQVMAEKDLKIALKPLFIGVLEHPEIGIDAEFVDLREEFTTQEDMILRWRNYYNSIARQLNSMIARFPHRIIARRLQINKVELYPTSEVNSSVGRID